MPRLHLIGTLCLVLVVTLAMAAFYSWRNEREHRASFERIEQVITQQQRERLTTEVQSAVGYLEFLRMRTEDVLRRSAVEQVDLHGRIDLLNGAAAQHILGAHTQRR
mgnify:CR=1 FL=1